MAHYTTDISYLLVIHEVPSTDDILKNLCEAISQLKPVKPDPKESIAVI